MLLCASSVLDLVDAAADPVVGFAQLCLQILRENLVSDCDILATFTTPNPVADTMLEKLQIAEAGYVYMPANAIKLQLRRLVLATPTPLAAITAAI